MSGEEGWQRASSEVVKGEYLLPPRRAWGTKPIHPAKGSIFFFSSIDAGGHAKRYKRSKGLRQQP